MEKGKLVEFRLQGERRLAVVDRPEGKKDWIVVDQGGQPHKIRPQWVEYTVIGGPYRPADIPSFLSEAAAYIDPSSLEVAWEILSEEGKSVTPEEMAQLLFSQKNPVLVYAAHSLLTEDKIYFKRKGENYEPRPPSQVEEIKHQLDVEQQRQREKEGFLNRLQQALKGEKVTWVESDRTRLEALEKLVLFPEQKSPLAQEILALAESHSSTPEAAFELLVRLGWWSPHENLFLRRSSYPVQFPKKVLEVAHLHLQSSPSDADINRRDLTALKTYTIDDESTEEVLSFWTMANLVFGFILLIPLG